MFQSLVFDFIMACWGLFIVVWSIGSVYNRLKAPSTKERKFASPSAITVMFLIFLASLLLRIPLLDGLVSLPVWLTLVGIVLLGSATALTFWARFVLGTMWAQAVEAKVDHQLRTDGPYRLSRHPIYTGMIGMTIGSLLASGFAPFWFLSVMTTTFVFGRKMTSEENLMLETFGDQYAQYQGQVPQLIPGWYWLKKMFSFGKKGNR